MAGGELWDKTLANVFPDMVGSFQKALRGVRETAGELQRLNGLIVSLDCTPVIGHGRSAGMVISFQNITKIQQLEEQIRKKFSGK